MITDELVNLIADHEGLKLKPYLDTVGVWTVGYGHNLNVPISTKAAKQILLDDIADAMNDCIHAFPWFMELSEPRQHAMIDLMFNMGMGRLSGFKKFLQAMSLGNYDTAADELVDSKWYEQVKRRGPKVVAMIRGSEQV